MICALLILAGVWLGATVGYIFVGILLMGRDAVAHPALAAPAIAAAIAPDPIFAAIERHRAAAAAFDAGIDEEILLEEALPADKCKAHCRGDDASTDDPRWQNLRRRYWAVSDQMDQARQQLFEAPTSVAGLVVLVDYLDEIREQGNGTWEDAWSLPDPEEMLSAIADTVRRLQGGRVMKGDSVTA